MKYTSSSMTQYYFHDQKKMCLQSNELYVVQESVYMLLNMFYFISHEKILGRTQMLRSCPLPITVTRVFRYLFMQQNIHTNVTSIIPHIQHYKITIHNVTETCFRMGTVHSSLWNNTKHRNNLEFIESNPQTVLFLAC